MLIRFKVSNFRAFWEPQEISFVASSLKGPPDSVVRTAALPEGLLRVAAIYGANASGKTTFLRALEFFVSVVRDSHRVWKPDSPIPWQPFLLDEKASGEPSTFRIDFVLDGVRYEFGFSLRPTEVAEEWLHSFPSGRKQVWYERSSGSTKLKLGKKLSGENRVIESLTRPNSLFLSAAAQNNHEQLLPIFKWLTSRILFQFGDRDAFSGAIAEKCEQAEMRSRLSALLVAADLGITGIDVTKEQIETPEGKIGDALRNFIQTLSEVEGFPSDQMKFPLEIPQVMLLHRSAAQTGIRLPNGNESAGTAAFLSLLVPALELIASGGVLCVDELDSSLHPLLALEIVRLFAKSSKNPRSAQLLFNTHDVNLLDSSVLRRDEIWFCEKDEKGCAHLYSLSDFKPKENENFKRGYLQGRYGAVPFLGSFDFQNQSS